MHTATLMASLQTNGEVFQVSVLMTRSGDCQTEILHTLLLNLTVPTSAEQKSCQIFF